MSVQIHSAAGAGAQAKKLSVFHDLRLAISAIFRRGNRKIEPLAELAENLERRGGANSEASAAYLKEAESLNFLKAIPLRAESRRHSRRSKLQYWLAGKAQMSLAKAYASEGKYFKAGVRASNASISSMLAGRSNSAQLAMSCFYGAKRCEAEGDFDGAAVEMKKSCEYFLKAKKLKKALDAGLEAAELFIKADNPKEALALCDKLALIAKEKFEYSMAQEFYHLASTIAPEREQSLSYTKLADDCLELEIKKQAGLLKATRPSFQLV